MTRAAVNSQSDLKARPDWAHGNPHSHITMTQLSTHWTAALGMELNTRCSFALPLPFKELVHRYCSGDTGPFSLTNRDFGFHNVLVDYNFSIIGVIDFDGIMAAPKEVVGQFPALCALGPPAPGAPPRNEFVKAREEQEKPSIESCYVASNQPLPSALNARSSLI